MSSELEIWMNSPTTTLEGRKSAINKESSRKTKGGILRSLPVFSTVPSSKSSVFGGKKQFWEPFNFFHNNWSKEHVSFVGQIQRIRSRDPDISVFTSRFLQVPEHWIFTNGCQINEIWVTQGRRRTQEELQALEWNSDKVSTTGWQAHDGRGGACGRHAACQLTARAYMGRVPS